MAGAILLGVALPACAGAVATTGATDQRHPEQKRPEAPRSASDDEVLGAQEQDPADTLRGSLTNEHPAPRSPHAESPAQQARERLEYERCIEASKPGPMATGAEPQKRPVCKPPGANNASE